MGVLHTVNVGDRRPIAAKSGSTGIDKRPVDGPVVVRAPEPGGSGLAGDTICDVRHHGGADQAVYAYAREDLDGWEPTLGPLPSGTFGENLTTRGVDVTGAVIGERWRVGADLVLQVTTPRVPCRTFATWLDRRGWVRAFTEAARPGAYLRVVESGEVRAGDPVTVVDRPAHGVTIGTAFRAFTTAPDLLPLLAAVDELPAAARELVARRTPLRLDDA